MVAELYKNRWQIELFFKWLKQHLKIKKFWGTTENAVRIQIYVAICTYLLVTIVKNDMKLERSTYEVLQILSISLTDKTHLKGLFDKTKFQYDKDHFGPNGPNLFNVQLVPHFYGTLMSHFYSFFNSLSFKLNNLILPMKCSNGNLRMRFLSTTSTTPSLGCVFSSSEASSAMR